LPWVFNGPEVQPSWDAAKVMKPVSSGARYGKPSGAFRREVPLGRRISTEDVVGRRETSGNGPRQRGRRRAQPSRNTNGTVALGKSRRTC